MFVRRDYGNKLGCRGPGSVSGGTGLDLCRGDILGIKRFLKQSSISLRTKGLLRILSGAANAEASRRCAMLVRMMRVTLMMVRRGKRPS